MNDGLRMRTMRGDRDHRQENADHAHENPHASGIGIGGMFRFDFDFRHGAKISSKVNENVWRLRASAAAVQRRSCGSSGLSDELVHLTTCRRGLARAIPRTPLRTTST